MTRAVYYGLLATGPTMAAASRDLLLQESPTWYITMAIAFALIGAGPRVLNSYAHGTLSKQFAAVELTYSVPIGAIAYAAICYIEGTPATLIGASTLAGFVGPSTLELAARASKSAAEKFLPEGGRD